MKRVLPLIVCLLSLTACGSSNSVTTGVQSGPSPTATLAPVHPCLLSDWYMQCKNGAPGQTTGTLSQLLRSGNQFGLDFAWGGPWGSVAARHGARFACSYVSNSRKDWSWSLLHSYLSAGRSVCLVWETAAARALSGYWGGRSDARAAAQEAAGLGEPRNRPIFFGVDFDTSTYGCAICSYFDGVKSILGYARTGAYGGLATMRVLFNTHRIAYGWQTLAWSYGHWDPRAHLRQTSINDHWFGYSVDYDVALAPDYGQWPYATPARLVCFGRHANLRNATCKHLRAEVASWQRAANSSARAFKVRACPELTLRANWFARQIRLHPRSPRTAYRRRALVTTRRVYTRQSCSLFQQRNAYFSQKARQTVRRYS